MDSGSRIPTMMMIRIYLCEAKHCIDPLRLTNIAVPAAPLDDYGRYDPRRIESGEN